MFSKGISASLLEATKKVMKDEESGLRMAAHAAHRQGKKMFHFQGKTYPITVKEDIVEIGEPLEEAESPYKEKTSTGMRVYGSSYGNSAKAKRDQGRHAVDDVRGPSKKDMEKAHTEKNPEHYKDKDKDYVAKQYKKDSVQKYFSKVGEEVELDEKDELRGRIGTNIVNKKPREGQTDLRNIPAGNRPDGKNKFSQGERDSQPTRLKNDIKASLGKHTKPNLPEEIEGLAEEDKHVKMAMGILNDKRYKGGNLKGAVNAIEKMKPGLSKHPSVQKAMKAANEEVELDEAGDCVTPPEAKDIAKKEVGSHEKKMHKKGFKDKLIEREMTAAQSKKKEKIVMSMKDKTEYFKKKYGKNWKSVMYATATKNAMKEEVELDEAEMTTDMLRGRVEGGKDTHGMTGDFKSFKVKLKGELEKRPDESDVTKPNTDNQGETAERQKITTNPGPVDIKMDDKYGHPNNHDHGQYYDPQRHSKYDMTKTGMRHEEVELDETTGVTDYNPKSQGGTRKELLKKYAKSGDPKHAEAARKAGATQSELKTARVVDSMFGHRGGVDKLGIRKEEVEQIEEANITHAAHFDDPKTGKWASMALLTAKNDQEAMEQAKDLLRTHAYRHYKLSAVEKHEPIKMKMKMKEEVTEAKDPHIDAGVGAQPNEAMGHTPLTRAKEMARNAMNRVKTEMLGKAPGNN